MKQKFTMPTGEIVEKDFPQFKTPYNHDTEFESNRTASYSTEPSLTKQEFKDETDINVILDRFMRTGEPPPMAMPEHFQDTTTRRTWFEAEQEVAETSAMFYELPARIRSAFGNRPGAWADAVVQAAQAGDIDAMRQMGVDATLKPQDAAPKGGDTTPVTPPTNGAPAAPTAATPQTGAPGAAAAAPKT